MKLFDTHAHLDEEQLRGDTGALLDRARQAGVATVITVGTTAKSSEACVALAARHEGVFAAVGVQPNYVAEATASDWAGVVQLASESPVRAIGETGLDAHWDFTPMDAQRIWFDRHVRLSQQTDLPFIVHMRECGDDVLDLLREARQRGPLLGVMHSFTGDPALAEHCLTLGLYISFAGMVTFKKNAELRETARQIPADRILIETDAPYLSPHPRRGQRPNEPALLVHTASCLAGVRGVSREQFALQTTANARRLFGVVEPS